MFRRYLKPAKVDTNERLRRIHEIVAAHASFLGSLVTTTENLTQQIIELRATISRIDNAVDRMHIGVSQLESEMLVVAEWARNVKQSSDPLHSD